MELIKEIQLDSKEVKEAIAEYLERQGYKAVTFKYKLNMAGTPEEYPMCAAIVVEDIFDKQPTI
ncbi:hypothetical protein ABEI56_05400 [Peribacillus castrilensis]|uniref:hypothetical protein n=1 Tax=Peribacillus castrilensis TaxID=2897690 RepID=UPI003D28AD45